MLSATKHAFTIPISPSTLSLISGIRSCIANTKSVARTTNPIRFVPTKAALSLARVLVRLNHVEKLRQELAGGPRRLRAGSRWEQIMATDGETSIFCLSKTLLLW